MTQDKIFRIVWADDEIDTLAVRNEMIQKLLKSKGFKVEAYFRKSEELENFLDKYRSEIDAVIVDANFPDEDQSNLNEKDLSGLSHVCTFIKAFNSSKDKPLPFYLYTQRTDIKEQAAAKNIHMKYFENHNAIFFKDGGIKPVLERIKKDIEKYNSPDWIVYNQYSFELSCFEVFDNICQNYLRQPSKACELAKNLLLLSHTNKLVDGERYLNAIRCEVFDIMNAIAAKSGIVPEGLTLNEFSRLLCYSKVQRPEIGNPVKIWQLRNPVLDKALQEPMRYVLRMVQDGSHNIPEQVRQYIADEKKRENSILVRSILYTTIELVKWFILYISNNISEENNKSNIIEL